jgi:hypothetical protein
VSSRRGPGQAGAQGAGAEARAELAASGHLDAGSILRSGLGWAAVGAAATLTLGGVANAIRAAATPVPNPNIVYRALTAADRANIAAGQGISAKAPNGVWTAAEHVANFSTGSPGSASTQSPWISTTRLPGVAAAFDSGNGIAAIDLSKVPSLQVEVWKTAPRVNGVAGLAYHRSIWGQEVTIFQHIPASAIVEVK